MFWLRQIIREKKLILLILIIVTPLLIPLFHNGFFITDDGEWMIIRLTAFYQALADGQFPVRYLGRLNHDYGYPAPTFLYPGYLYLGSIIHLFKIGFVDTIKIILGLSIFSSFIFVFFWLKNLYGKIPALIASTFYIYSPYYLYDIFKRGSVGEVLAMSIIPFILWQIERKSLFWIAIGIGLLILSHNTLALFFMLFLLSYMVFKIYHEKNKIPLIYHYISSSFLGVGLSAFFWLPIIFEINLTKFSQVIISNPKNYFADLNIIGYQIILVFVVSLIIFYEKKFLQKKYKVAYFMFLLGIVSLFLSSELSAAFWGSILDSFIQFPFRLLSITILAATYLTAFIFHFVKNPLKIILVIIILLLTISTLFKYFNSLEFIEKGEGFYATNNSTTTIHDEYMPLWVRENPNQRPSSKVEIIHGRGLINELRYDNRNITINLKLFTDSTIQLNTIYWPGWNVYVNGEKVEIMHNNPRGIMHIDANKGNYKMNIEFTETYYRRFANIISVLSFAFVLFLSLKKYLWK